MDSVQTIDEMKTARINSHVKLQKMITDDICEVLLILRKYTTKLL